MRDLKATLRHHRERAAEYNQHLDYAVDDLRRLRDAACGKPCRFCRNPLGEPNYQFDHATPISRRGSFCLWNLQVVCDRCNALKGRLTLEEFASLWDLLRGLHPDAQSDITARLIAGAAPWKRRKTKKGGAK
jgi:5-methylcytosine-specific restriction endonuclease McrA